MQAVRGRNWREKPPGPEQVELERLFYSNEINYNSNPASVQQAHKIFQDFSEKIFSAHFRKTRAMLALCASAPSVPASSQHKDDASKIPELGVVGTSLSTLHKSFQIDDSFDVTPDFYNPPFCMWMYTDHRRKNDFVCVALPIFSGAQNINFDLSEDGTKVTLKFAWPNELFKAKELFQSAFAANEITEDHPKVHAFVSNLQTLGITEQSKPQGSITIHLLCRVKREIGSWVKKALKIQDTKIVLLEFTAYQKALLVNDADTSLVF